MYEVGTFHLWQPLLGELGKLWEGPAGVVAPPQPVKLSIENNEGAVVGDGGIVPELPRGTQLLSISYSIHWLAAAQKVVVLSGERLTFLRLSGSCRRCL
jgi:hypothetical protein